MARGLEHDQAHPPEPHFLAVAHGRERILRDRARTEVDRGLLAVAKLQMTGDEVGVEMSQEHVCDSAAEPPRISDVLLDIPLRIDDRRLTAVLIGDQVRRVGQTAEVRGCPSRRGTLVTAVPKSWLHSEGGCELLVGGLVGVAAPVGEVVFDRDREAGEAAVAGYFAEPDFGFEHPSGGG